MGHVEVGWVMQGGWGRSCRGGVGHVGGRGEVGHTGVGWARPG